MENEDIEVVEAEILPNDSCKELVATGEILEDEKNTIDDILEDADSKNSKRIAEDLKELGDEYEYATARIIEGKLSCKSILDRAKEIGITKGMIETYISMKNYNNLNRFAVMGAISEEQ